MIQILDIPPNYKYCECPDCGTKFIYHVEEDVGMEIGDSGIKFYDRFVEQMLPLLVSFDFVECPTCGKTIYLNNEKKVEN